MTRHLRPALTLFILFNLMLGVAYPAAISGIAQTFFPHQANGSQIENGAIAAGSSLIGRDFSDPGHFWSRPSATRPSPYNIDASGASQLSPANPSLIENVRNRIHALREADPDNRLSVPVDLVTSSASGLDPHISPAAALYQVSRVARARGQNEEALRTLVARFTEPRTFGLLGEPRVNVVLLNLALDEQP